MLSQKAVSRNYSKKSKKALNTLLVLLLSKKALMFSRGEIIAGKIKALDCNCYGSEQAVSYYCDGLCHTIFFFFFLKAN